MIWREKQGWLIALAVLLLANVLFFVTYRVQFQKRLDDVETKRDRADEQLAQARATRVATEQQFARYRKVQADLDSLYNTRWSTENERLTALIREVKKLAEVTKLSPPAYSFSQAEEKEAALQKQGVGTRTVGITFTVQGSYPQLRRLINLLELTPQFVIIDALSVNVGNDSNNLTMSLRLKTLFREPRRGAVVAPVNQEM